jgi:hypothetical protein
MRERERSKVEHFGDLQGSLHALVFLQFQTLNAFHSVAWVRVL